MKKKKIEKIKIFTYFSYRDYLDAVYTFRKKMIPRFSHRSFSSDAGISSPNYLFRVLKGERNLTVNYVPNFSKALDLSKEEELYFEALVMYNNAKKYHDKEEYLKKLLSLRHEYSETVLEGKQNNYFSKWYYPVLRELVTICNFEGDFEFLGEQCIPAISAKEAENGIKYLLKNGYIVESEDGGYERNGFPISTGSSLDSITLRKYHKENLEQTCELLEGRKPKMTDISSLTVPVSEETYEQIKEEIEACRKRVLSLVVEENEPSFLCRVDFSVTQKSSILE